MGRAFQAKRVGVNAFHLVWPLVFVGAEAFHDGVEADVAPFFLRFLFIAQAVIEEIVLPFYVLEPGSASLPLTDRFGERYLR
jgi:hypothetical protein